MNNIFNDIREMYLKYGLITGDETPHITKHMEHRINHLKEELAETILAVENDDLEEVIDGLIDLMVISAGTLEMCGIKSKFHWDEVLRANMTKERGVNPKRGHDIDIIKPLNWIGPNHSKILKWYS